MSILAVDVTAMSLAFFVFRIFPHLASMAVFLCCDSVCTVGKVVDVCCARVRVCVRVLVRTDISRRRFVSIPFQGGGWVHFTRVQYLTSVAERATDTDIVAEATQTF